MGVSERRLRETEVLKQQVLDAAEDIFVHEGAHRVTMRRIAARIEYAPTVLYRLFANKADLVNHLIARGYQGVRSRYEEALRQAGRQPLEILAAILEAYVVYALEHPNHYRMWFDTGRLRMRGGVMEMSHGQLAYVVFRTWLDRIEACREAGLFPGRDAADVFQVLWPRVHGLISLRLQHPEFPWPPIARHLKDVLDLGREAATEG